MPDSRDMGMIVNVLLLIKQIWTLCVTTGVLCFWPAPGFLWEDNILFCLHVYLSCGQLAFCWQMITAFIHNDCDRKIVCARLRKMCVCLSKLVHFSFILLPEGIFDSKRLLCCRLNLFKVRFNWSAVTTVWSPFWINTLVRSECSV